MADRVKGITIEIGGDTTKLSKALEGVNKNLKTAQDGLKDVDKLLKLDPGNVELLRQKQDYLNDAIAASKEKLEQEKAAMEQLKNSDGFDKNSEQAKALQRQIEEDEQALKNLKDQAKEFGNVAAQEFKLAGEKVKDFGGKITDVGKGMTTKISAPIAGVAAASIAAFNEVDAGLDTIVVKTGASGEALAGMQSVMENIATTVPTDFETIGTAVGEVNTRFGLTGDELESLSSDFIKFATINGTDVNSAIDQTQKALTAFGESTDNASTLLDTLNLVGQNTGVSMDTLMSGLVSNSAAFQELGLSIYDSATLMGQLEVSGADVNTVMGGLQKALKNATEDGVPLNEALTTLQDTILNGTETTDGLTAAYDLFGKSGAQIYEAVKNGTIDFQNLSGAAQEAGGSVGTTFEATLDPVDEFTTAMNAAKIAGADLGSVIQEQAAPLLSQLVETIKSLTEGFRSLTPEQQQTIIKIGAIVAALGPAIAVIGTIITGIGSVIGVLGTVIGVLGGPLTIAIGAVIAIGITLYKNWDTIKEKAGKLKDSIVEKFTKIKDTIEEKINKAKETVHNAIEKIKGFFNFEWHLPHLKMPHFTISGEFSLNPPSAPHFGIDWYKKAYQNPVMFTSPTVLQTASGLKGFGDGSGAEIVMGLNKLRELVGGSENININVYGAQGQDVKALATEVEKALVRAQRSRSAVFA